MLKIFKDLEPFFHDNYIRIHVREYASQRNISPPTASKLLEDFFRQGLLKKEIDRRYHLYYANKDSHLFKDLQQIFWANTLTPVLEYIERQVVNPKIVLFGSAAKAELTKTSDIDLALFFGSTKDIHINSFEKKLGRDIQLFIYQQIDDVPTALQNNIRNGKLLRGLW